jgi:hypothetical protein
VVLHLLLALHEDEGSVRGDLVLSRLRDEPSLAAFVGDVAVVGRNGLELDLHLALHRATDREVWLLIKSLKDNLLLNKVLVLVRADPSGAGSESGRILLSFVGLFNHVVARVGAHDVEGGGRLLGRGLGVSNFIEVVVNDLSKIDQGVLLNLNRSVHVHLDS